MSEQPAPPDAKNLLAAAFGAFMSDRAVGHPDRPVLRSLSSGELLRFLPRIFPLKTLAALFADALKNGWQLNADIEAAYTAFLANLAQRHEYEFLGVLEEVSKETQGFGFLRRRCLDVVLQVEGADPRPSSKREDLFERMANSALGSCDVVEQALGFALYSRNLQRRGVKSLEVLDAEYQRWVSGDLDGHDLAVHTYKKSVLASCSSGSQGSSASGTMSRVHIPSKASLLGSPAYDVQQAADNIVALIREYRVNNPGSPRVAIPASSLRAICPDLPGGDLGSGGVSWQLVKKAFEDNDYVVRYETLPSSDVVVFE